MEVAEVPTVTAPGEDAAIVKSRTMTVTVVELVVAPLAAFTVTV